MKSKTKLNSEVKYARIERKWLNASKWHQISVRRYHRADRKASKLQLKSHIGVR